MGRNKKYNTDEERKRAKLERWHRWYMRNKVSHNKLRMEKYYEKKDEKE